MAAGRDRIERLARRAAGGDLAAARELVRELEARQQPDNPGDRWVVVKPPENSGGPPLHVGVRSSRSEAIKLAMEFGADETGSFDMVAKRGRGYAPAGHPSRMAVREIVDLDLLQDLLNDDSAMGIAYEHPGYVSVSFTVHSVTYEMALGWDGDVGPYGSLRTLEGDDLETYYYDLGGGFDEQVDWIARTIRKAYADVKSGRFD